MRRLLMLFSANHDRRLFIVALVMPQAVDLYLFVIATCLASPNAVVSIDQDQLRLVHDSPSQESTGRPSGGVSVATSLGSIIPHRCVN